MWHPNKAQWWVVWIAVAVVGLVLAIPMGGGILGIAVLIAVLLVWQMEGRRGKP
jgi:hypothetical protein